MNNTEDDLGVVAALIISFLVLPFSIFLYAVTSSYLWEWFVVSQFGVPSLGLAAAYGLIFTTRFFTRGANSWAEHKVIREMSTI